MNKRQHLLSILINLIIFLSTLIIACKGILYGAGGGQVGEGMIGWGYFKAFTMDSNILAGIVSFFVLLDEIKYFRGKKRFQETALNSWRLAAATALSLTFIVVFLFLIPMWALNGQDARFLIKGEMAFFHVLNPFLAVISFCYLSEGSCSKAAVYKACIFVLGYGLVYTIMVVFLKCWSDFYGFTFGGHYYLSPIVFIIILSVTLGLSKGLFFVKNRNVRKQNEKKSD